MPPSANLRAGAVRAIKMSSSYDVDLARRLQRRDPYALGELYDRYGKIVWSLIRTIVRDQAAAEDLTEETFLRVWNRVHAFDANHGAIGPWLLTIARDRAIDHLRSRSPRIERAGSEDAIREHPALFIGIDKEVLNVDHPLVIGNAFGKLDPAARKALDLAYYEGLPEEEIAGRLGEPLDAVKTSLRDALNRIREQLGKAVIA